MRIAIIGRSEILLETAERLIQHGYQIPLIITAKEAPEYLKKAKDFKIFAKKINASFIMTSYINNNIDKIQKLGPFDIAISMNYTGIISKKIIDCFKLGILNAHGGDLPRYRGNACQAWAILNSESRIGLCIHKMIGGEIDSGDIIARDYISIDQNTKITQVWEWISQRIPYLFLEAVEKLKDNSDYILERQSKDPGDALRCYPRRPEDGRINWNQSALQILHLINASNKPYAGAFCEVEGEKTIIWEAELIDDKENFLAVPGQVILIGDGFIDVACGAGKLRIKIIEYHDTEYRADKVIRSIRLRLK